jgi:hypothetical protein
MGKLSNGVQRRKRDGTSLLIIDFRFRDKDGRGQRDNVAMLACRRERARKLKRAG